MGYAVRSGDAIVIEKHVGKIGEAQVSLPESTIGIGHTRWATHVVSQSPCSPTHGL